MSELHIRIVRRAPKPDRRPTRLNALVLWLSSACGLLIFPFFSAPLASLIGNFNPHVQMLISNLLYYIPFIVLPIIVLTLRRPGLYVAYRPNPISLFNVTCTVIIALLGVFFANDVATLWAIPLQKLGFNVFSSTLPVAANRFELMLSVLYAAVLPGICEEFLFRGALLSAFEEDGTRRAMWISSLLFMLVHGSVTGAPVQLILGMILSYVVVWTNSIYAGLIYHTVHNATSVLLQYAQNRALASGGATAEITDLLEYLGGIGGVGMLVVEILFFAAMILFSLKMFKFRGRLMGISEEPFKKRPLTAREWIILLLSIIACCLLYAMDIYTYASFPGGQA